MRIRSAALAILALVGGWGCTDPASRPTSWWIQQLREDDAEDRAEARKWLVIRGREAVPELVRELQSDDLVVCMSAAECLGSIGKDAVPAVTEALKSGPTSSRRWAIEALRRSGKDAREAIPVLEEAAKDPALRQSATLAIEAISKS
jgi:HEAT repeat protein